MENIEVLELKKDSIVALMKRYKKEFIKIDDSLDLELSGSAGNSFYNIKFDVKNDKYLYIKDITTLDNISLYYEFMNDDDIFNNIELLNSVLFDRYFYILTHFKEIGFICEDKNVYKSLRDWEQIQFKNKHIKRDGYKYYEISFFDIKDTLKPIDEYIEEIKQSEAYKEYIAKKS